jgi:hypothetical protein
MGFQRVGETGQDLACLDAVLDVVDPIFFAAGIRGAANGIDK